MCGLTGFLETRDAPDVEVLTAMTDALAHRGPDDSGLWLDARAGVALGHTRLAVVDLSPLGHQPMQSDGGRYVIAYNGEVYNFPELRAELERAGHTFQGRSDTEVVLAACEAWGPEAALTRFVGMFAFALWDRETRRLFLARDRMGEKPLYYGWAGATFLFGSELRALTRHPAWIGEVDRGALCLLLRHNYIPAPESIYRGIGKLPPGTCLWVDPGAPGGEGPPVPFWSVRRAAERGREAPFAGDGRDAADELEVLLRRSVRGQLIADVPLGVFLSGGIDSSTVAALAQAESDRPVRTFTVGFHEAAYDEAPHARAVAAHLGTEHTELYVTPADALDLVPRLPQHYAEPFADVSQIPTLLLCRMARRDVTVALAGDGGDELFAGYGRYATGRALGTARGLVPARLRGPLADAVRRLPPDRWDGILRPLEPLLRRFGRVSTGHKLHALAEILSAPDEAALYRRVVSHWDEPARVVPGGAEPPTVLAPGGSLPDLPGITERMTYWDMRSYLPDDVLVKVDRASMAVALEAREPLLDHRVVEFAWRLPLSMKVRAGRTKWLLRQVLYRHVPPRLVERPKAGFAVPLGEWLRGPLRDWAEALLAADRLKADGYLDPVAVRTRWAQHLAGSHDWRYHLWNVLMFQAWLEGR